MTDEETHGPYSESAPPTLDFEAWAAVSAALLERCPKERAIVLTKRGLSDASWSTCNAHWGRQLLTNIARGEEGMVVRYGQVCREELQQRANADDSPRDSLDGTAVMTQVPVREPLPFRSEDSASPQMPPTRVEQSPHGAVGATVEVGALVVKDPLPFK